MIHHEGTKDMKASADRVSYEIVGAAIEVHRQLGPGLLESAYEACLCREFSVRRVGFERQVSLPWADGTFVPFVVNLSEALPACTPSHGSVTLEADFVYP